jgi:hypothetical protein
MLIPRLKTRMMFSAKLNNSETTTVIAKTATEMVTQVVNRFQMIQQILHLPKRELKIPQTRHQMMPTHLPAQMAVNQVRALILMLMQTKRTQPLTAALTEALQVEMRTH